jgi:hypothetical protein
MNSSINDMVSTITGGVRANTAQEENWLKSAPKEMQDQMKAQITMQKEQELIQMLAQAMKQISELSKSTIRMIGG